MLFRMGEALAKELLPLIPGFAVGIHILLRENILYFAEVGEDA